MRVSRVSGGAAWALGSVEAVCLTTFQARKDGRVLPTTTFGGRKCAFMELSITSKLQADTYPALGP
ncbi:MAG: hypothetical protein GY696_31010 [Gammaproteobacteria bacterium]|nr:hypothetical protein [Gammaproteobacteria bacterium]